MLTLKDGRTELWQWDTGREVKVDGECSQVHFSNKIQGRSIDVDVVDGVAKIPDVLLQTDGTLNAWAFVGAAENGYTKVSKSFVVNKRNRPADYVFTPTDQTSIKELNDRLEKLEANQDPEAVSNAVKEYLENNPIKEKDPTVPQWAKEEEKPKYTAKEVGAIGKEELQGAVDMALEQAKASGEFDGRDGTDGQDGTSPIISVLAIAGGHRITITDKNGTKSVDVLDGQDGKEGSDGADGQDGADGVGIASIEQTTTSTADDGNNVITITLTNGQTATFTVQNGSKGSIGPAGKDGSDATVTAQSIKAALNYTPADQTEVTNLSKEIADLAVTPQMYGAKGDGVTDDTQALVNALAENDTVFLPKGTYLIKTPLQVNGKKLYGCGIESTVKYQGSDCVFVCGRRTKLQSFKVLVDSTSVSSIFNTDNRRVSIGSGTMLSYVDDIEVYFNTIAESFDTTLINIVASNKDYLSQIGFHNLSYSNIRVAGVGKYKCGIKITVNFDVSCTSIATMSWITDVRFSNIWLYSPETGIKICREVADGVAITYEPTRAEQIMFTDVATQYVTDGYTKKFYDVEHCIAEFTNCVEWDYHYVINRGEKYNVTGAGSMISLINAKRSPIEASTFPEHSDITPESDPAFFMKKYFRFVSLMDNGGNGYDSVNAKIDAKLSDEHIANIVDEKVSDILYSGYSNIMDNPLTQVKIDKRWSASSNAWVDESKNGTNTTVIIPIVAGGNIIRWQPSTYELAISYEGMYFFDDDELATAVQFVGLASEFWDSENGYLVIDNPSGYKYVSIPFKRYTDISSETMVMTINRKIVDGAEQSYTEYLRENVIAPAVDEAIDNKGFLTEVPSEYITETELTAKKYLTAVPSEYVTETELSAKKYLTTIPSEYVTETELTAKGYALKSSAETWTFTLADGSVVTKKVVLA